MASSVGAPRPRVLVHGLTDAEIEIVRPLAGSLVVTEDPSAVYPEEHDALIVTNAQFHHYRQGFARRLVFAPAAEPEPTQSAGRSFGYEPATHNTFASTRYRPARDFISTKEAEALGVAALVLRSCKPAADSPYTGFATPVKPERVTYPLLQEDLKRPLTLAAVLEAQDRKGIVDESVIWLPDIARRALREWVRFAFDHWRERAPETFALTAEWTKAERWSSPGELAARNRLTELDRAEAQRRERALQERRRVESTLAAAESEGASWRALLTATGNELVAAVKDALEQFEFEVMDADGLPQHKGAKREDLRVRDGEWTALVEVKGVGGAAKSNDLDQMTRAAMTYVMSEHKEPDALWYIPNPEREIDPSQRKQALVGRDDALASFAQNFRGCLIDTRDLFTLRQRLATGATSAKGAREELKAALGRYSALEPPSR